MPIFKLSPRDKDVVSVNLKATIHWGNIVVRAKTEDRARLVAHRDLGIAVQKEPDGRIPTSPWSKKSGLADCAEISGTSYSEDGPEGVIEPVQFKTIDEQG